MSFSSSLTFNLSTQRKNLPRLNVVYEQMLSLGLQQVLYSCLPENDLISDLSPVQVRSSKNKTKKNL